MMWPYYGDGSTWVGWLWMAAMMIVFWGGIVFLAVWLTRSIAGPGTRADDAINSLRRRLAAGEISQDDFEKTKRLLQG